MKLDLLPINIAVKDCHQSELLKACVYLGECEVQLDHVYERKNILRVLGLNMERSTNTIFRETGVETKTDLKEFEIFAITILEEFEKTTNLLKKVIPNSVTNKEIRQVKSQAPPGHQGQPQSGYGMYGSNMPPKEDSVNSNEEFY